jgi:hypothetical protein
LRQARRYGRRAELRFVLGARNVQVQSEAPQAAQWSAVTDQFRFTKAAVARLT